MLIGSYTDAGVVLAGGILGAALSGHIPQRLKDGLPMMFGLASMGMGVSLIVHGHAVAVMVLSLLLGVIIGESCALETHLGVVSTWENRLVGRFVPMPADLMPEVFLERFVALTVLFCASGTGIFGAIHEGMTGDPSILLAKSVLDFLTAAIFATTLGFAVAAICIPQLAVLLALATGATYLAPLTTPLMNDNFAAVGGVLMLATGFRICGIVKFPVGNILPALVLAMPMTTIWLRFVGP
ncbi:DUF554 domain-containing protein [Komagataeibacter xylinus]|uniref:DUF554 domain-containing protein n=1 Tax=Komagataeibacter xylinus TaxID=28448 RepID=A0A857FRE5_KOMXY|nr:DUF554 domain-containing protein [Komagataeibacter xylinus]QHC36833.1 DUF554 domain-containing protein [Komagataeibacter xylinus]